MSAFIEGQPGALPPDNTDSHWVTPLVDFFAKHPEKAAFLFSAAAGLAIGVASRPLISPALANFIEQLSMILK